MKLEFGHKEFGLFGLLRWNNLCTWNSSFLDSSSIKPEARRIEEDDEGRKMICRSKEEQGKMIWPEKSKTIL